MQILHERVTWENRRWKATKRERSIFILQQHNKEIQAATKETFSLTALPLTLNKLLKVATLVWLHQIYKEVAVANLGVRKQSIIHDHFEWVGGFAYVRISEQLLMWSFGSGQKYLFCLEEQKRIKVSQEKMRQWMGSMWLRRRNGTLKPI